MSLPRFHAPRLDGDVIRLAEAEARHALLSLRLGPGDPVELFDGAGGVARGLLQAGGVAAPRTRKAARTRGEVLVSVQSIVLHPPPAQQLTLVTAGCKGDRLEWLVEKCTELGADAILLARFRRSIVNVGPQHAEKLRRTAIEACKQCGRNFLPRIEVDADLDSILARACNGSLRGIEPAGVTDAEQNAEGSARGIPETPLVLADPDPNAPTLAAWLAHPHRAASLAAIVGPEGGLAPEELERLSAAEVARVRLADHILRVETAAVAIAACWSAHPRQT